MFDYGILLHLCAVPVLVVRLLYHSPHRLYEGD